MEELDLKKLQEELLESYRKKEDDLREKLIAWIEYKNIEEPINVINKSDSENPSSSVPAKIKGKAHEEHKKVEDITQNITIVEAVENGLEIKTINKNELDEEHQIVLIEWKDMISDDATIDDVDDILLSSEEELKKNIEKNDNQIQSLKDAFQQNIDSKTPSSNPHLRNILSDGFFKSLEEEATDSPKEIVEDEETEEDEIDFDDMDMGNDEKVEESTNDIENSKEKDNQEENKIELRKDGKVLFIGNNVNIKEEAGTIANLSLLTLKPKLQEQIERMKAEKSIIETSSPEKELETPKEEESPDNDIDDDIDENNMPTM